MVMLEHLHSAPTHIQLAWIPCSWPLLCCQLLNLVACSGSTSSSLSAGLLVRHFLIPCLLALFLLLSSWHSSYPSPLPFRFFFSLRACFTVAIYFLVFEFHGETWVVYVLWLLAQFCVCSSPVFIISFPFPPLLRFFAGSFLIINSPYLWCHSR